MIWVDLYDFINIGCERMVILCQLGYTFDLNWKLCPPLFMVVTFY